MLILANRHHSLTMFIWVALDENVKQSKNYKNMCETKISEGAVAKLPYFEKFGASISSWSHDLEGHAKKCVDDIANWRTE